MNISDTVAYKVSRSLHWFCAISYLFLAVSMPIMLDIVNNSAERRTAHDIHQSVALCFMIFLIIRFLWIWVSGSTGLKTVFAHKWQKIMARINHIFLYFLMISTPLSGITFKLASGKPLLFFGVEMVAPIEAFINDDLDYYASEFHYLIIDLFYVLLFLHVAGAILHWLEVKNLLPKWFK